MVSLNPIAAERDFAKRDLLVSGDVLIIARDAAQDAVVGLAAPGDPILAYLEDEAEIATLIPGRAIKLRCRELTIGKSFTMIQKCRLARPNDLLTRSGR